MTMQGASSSSVQAQGLARQLALPQQQMLFRYWHSLCETADDWPSWRAIRLPDIRLLLPHLLIIEPRPQPQGMFVRLAGSSLWDIHGREITGLTLAHEHWNIHDAYWRRLHERLMQQPQPECGHLKDEERAVVVFWMRLPLLGENGETWLLGLDIAVPMSRALNHLANDGVQDAASNKPDLHAAGEQQVRRIVANRANDNGGLHDAALRQCAGDAPASRISISIRPQIRQPA